MTNATYQVGAAAPGRSIAKKMMLMLLGMPCGQVVSAKAQASKDYIASCKNGSRYRVFVNAEDRVVAQKL